MSTTDLDYRPLVLDHKQMALIGGAARDAGLDAEATVAFIDLIERTAFEAAQRAATEVAMAMWPKMLDQATKIHQRTVERCAAEVASAQRGITSGFLTNHQPCLAAIRRVGAQPAQV